MSKILKSYPVSQDYSHPKAESGTLHEIYIKEKIMDWKTTVFGAVASIAQLATTILPEDWKWIGVVVSTTALGLLGWYAKDKAKKGK